VPATIATGGVEAAPPLTDVTELGLFGAMALLATIQAGADPGYRHVRRLQARGIRLAPHRALRHEIIASLIEAGVLVPAAPRRLRLDATLADPDWEDGNIDDADWVIHWNDVVRSSLPRRLKEYLDDTALTTRNREVLIDTWTALAKAECLAFAEHALTAHRMDSKIALAAEVELGPVLARYSIGQTCAFMWWAAKNVASSFLRHGGQPGLAEREMSRSITNAFGRSDSAIGTVPLFRRHHTLPMSTFATAFLSASRLGDAYWSSPVSDVALEERFEAS
jgi:hypothetical protein